MQKLAVGENVVHAQAPVMLVSLVINLSLG